MARATHLADTSALARFDRPHVVASAAARIAAGQVALCAPVLYELGFGARSAADYDAAASRLDAFERAPTTEGDFVRALDIQQRLVHKGRHRAVSLVDALVAAVAESRGLVVLHYDADFELIAEITGQSTEWIVERGSAD